MPNSICTLLIGLSVLFITLAPTAADVLDLSNFQLRPNAYGTALRDRADALPLKKATVTNIMNDLNRQNDDRPVGIGNACEPKAVANGSSPAIDRSICFNKGDSATTQWYPQGVTTVADMQADQQWGNGYQPILVSWYDHNNNADHMVKGVRISFINFNIGAYRHVLLVYPREVDGIMDYDSIRVSQDPTNRAYTTALHAGGILWYGNFLFVADTARGFRMFDMRRIFDLGASPQGTTDGPHLIGYHKIGTIGTYFGYGYRYIMPQIGSWTRTARTGTRCSDNDGSPNFSYVSLDRSSDDHLVAGEYCEGDRPFNGRVATWKIADAFRNGELIMDPDYRWKADHAYKLPVSNIQGALQFEGKWYLSQSHGKNSAGTLHTTAKVTDTTKTLQITGNQTLPIGPEDLSHWPKGTATDPTLGVFWTVSEHPGQRMVYSIIPKN